MSWLSSVRTSLHDVGLNVCGVADGRAHDHLLPGCQRVVVFASGGVSLWEAFVADLRQHPEHLTEHTHPLDDFVARAIQRADPSPPSTRRWIRCAAQPEEFVDFRPLAQGAGLGWHSRTGLLLHPTYGLWMGMRAACFTTEPLPLSTPVSAPSPCDDCDMPCASACLGNAFVNQRLSIRRCAAFQVSSNDCHGQCVTRQACPEGQAHRHGELQHHYHYARGTGRAALADALGIEDRRQGIDPQWSDWADST